MKECEKNSDVLFVFALKKMISQRFHLGGCFWLLLLWGNVSKKLSDCEESQQEEYCCINKEGENVKKGI